MNGKFTRKQKQDEGGQYEIRIHGHLDDRWTAWFEGLTLTLEEDGNSLLSGSLADQAALHGILKKVRDLGIPLISINRVETNETHPNRLEKEIHMKSLQKFGGFSALYLAAAYLIGMILFLVVLDYPSLTDPAQKVALLVKMPMVTFSTNLLMYVFFGIILIVLSLALYDRLKSRAPALMQVATAIELIWAGSLIASGMVANAGIAPAIALYAKDPSQAALFWQGIESVASGLGNGNGEILGGLFVLLVSLAALRAGGLPKGLNILGLVVGTVGVLSILPGLTEMLTGVFGLSQMVWFVWLGIVLLRSHPGKTA